MWQAKYKIIDKSGLAPELKVTILYFNDTNSIETTYSVLPMDLNGESFKQTIQDQIDILNSKENLKSSDLDVLVDTAVDLSAVVNK